MKLSFCNNAVAAVCACDDIECVVMSLCKCVFMCLCVRFLHSNGDDRMTYLKETLALALTSLYWRFLRIPFSFFSALAGLFCLSFDLP